MWWIRRGLIYIDAYHKKKIIISVWSIVVAELIWILIMIGEAIRNNLF